MRLRRLLGVCLLALITATAAAEYDVMVAIPGGRMRKRSSAGPEDEDETEIQLLPFLLDKGPVTNAAFRQFVRDQKYKTEAEKFGWSFVFRDFVSDDVKSKVTHTIPSAPWWLPVQRAFWRQPAGSGSGIGARLDFPVVQVSWNDAQAFCRWKRKTLPTEDQWEWAARGGLARKTNTLARSAASTMAFSTCARNPAFPPFARRCEFSVGEELPVQQEQPVAGLVSRRRHGGGRISRPGSRRRLPASEQVWAAGYVGEHVGVDLQPLSGAGGVSSANVCAARRLLDRHGRRLGQSQSGSRRQDGQHPRFGLG